MTDPTIPEDRKAAHDAMDAVQRLIYSDEPGGFQAAQDSLNEAVHGDEHLWLSWCNVVLGQMQAYINISNMVNPTDEDAKALRKPVKVLEKAVNAAMREKAMKDHPAGKK